MGYRQPTLWETYEFIFTALESGRATFNEAREFHKLMLFEPNDDLIPKLMKLRKKLGIEEVPEGQVTFESLLAWTKVREEDRKYDTQTVSHTETVVDGKRHLEIEVEFIPRPKPASRKRKRHLPARPEGASDLKTDGI